MADKSDTIAQGLFAIAKSIDGLAKETGEVAMSLKYLGNGDAMTTMGAIEGLSVQLKQSLHDLGADHITAAEKIAENLSADASL